MDVEALAEKLSLRIVHRRVLQDEALLAPAQKTIYVRKSAPLVRRRFSIAHEIGHFVLDHERDRAERWDEETLNGSKVWETEANYFASNLLMPEALVAADFSSGMDLAVLSQKYVVSKEAMSIRLTQLRLS